MFLAKQKIPLVPASATAMPTSIFILSVLKQVSALGKPRKVLLSKIILTQGQAQAQAQEKPAVCDGN